MVTASSTGYEEERGKYSLRDLLTIVFKRRVLISLIAVSVVAVAMALSLRAPSIYEVTATLLVNEARAEMPIAPAASQPLIINHVSEQDLNSEIEVLKSRQLIEDVLNSLGIDENTVPEGGGKFSLRGWLKKLLGSKELSYFNSRVVHLQNAIGIEPVRRSNVIRIAYRSPNPEWATQVVGTLTERYLERRVERYQSPQAVVFFEQQMRDAETRLLKSEEALEKYVDESSITIVEESSTSDTLAAQKAVVMRRLAALETDYDSAEVELDSQRRRAASLREMLNTEPERLESSSRFNQDPSTEEIHRALTALRLERDRLLQDFKPDSRHVRDIDTQIRMAEARLEEAMGVSSVSGTESNPVYVQLKGELLREEAAIQGTSARVTSLRRQVSESRRQLEILNAKAFDLEILQRDTRAAEDDYLLYRKKHEEARISAAMDQEKFINVTVAQPAQLPLKPIPRGLMTRFIMALLVGVVGGIGFAFGLEMYLDRSFTTGEDVERQLGIPHIASIPESEMIG
jgi:uncharacterized protein involved in exopolysaccharide biosynthesis